MLHIMGIGYKKEHINLEMLKVIKSSSLIFLETYTSFYEDSLRELSKFINKEIIVCDRDDIEINIDKKIFHEAKTSDIVLMIIGDPLIATTHTDLILRCKELKINFKVYSNVSVINFICNTGLQFYKFGKITSIPFFSEKFMPRTPYLIYVDNYKMGAHTLFLLDLNPNEDIAYKGQEKYLKASDALKFMLDIPKFMLENEEIEEKEASFIDEETLGIICSRLGFEDEKILYGTISNLIEYDVKNNLKEPICLIIPGDLHEMELKFLSQFIIKSN